MLEARVIILANDVFSIFICEWVLSILEQTPSSEKSSE